jgi:hypothetical protein
MWRRISSTWTGQKLENQGSLEASDRCPDWQLVTFKGCPTAPVGWCLATNKQREEERKAAGHKHDHAKSHSSGGTVDCVANGLPSVRHRILDVALSAASGYSHRRGPPSERLLEVTGGSLFPQGAVACFGDDPSRNCSRSASRSRRRPSLCAWSAPTRLCVSLST